MNRSPLRFVFLVSLFFLLYSSISAEAGQGGQEESRDAARLLSVNRSLLLKAESERDALQEERLSHPSESLDRELEKSEYKIKALKEDAVQLQASLPPMRQANEFLKDLILQKRKAPKKAPARAEVKKGLAQQESVAELHERALKLVSEKKLKEASQLYEEIILRDPENDEAYLLMGHTYLLTGDYEKAEMAFHNAVHIDPENIREILPFYQNIALQNPGDDGAYSNLGFAYLILGDDAKAENAFKDSLGINPENGEAQKGMKIIARRL